MIFSNSSKHCYTLFYYLCTQDRHMPKPLFIVEHLKMEPVFLLLLNCHLFLIYPSPQILQNENVEKLEPYCVISDF